MPTGLGRKPTDADYGLGEHSFDADRLALLDDRELTDLLVRTFKQPSYRPPRLPAIATELLALSRRSDVEFKEIEALLEQDPMLAGEVLSIARSAYYSGVRPVSTLGAALVRIGLARLHEVVMQAALDMRVFRSASYGACMERLRVHSLATANICRLLSRYTPVTQQRAFLCGLLHDVGIAGILLVLGEEGPGRKAPDLTGLWPAIDAAHGEAGVRMVELWRLPPETAAAVAGHHRGSTGGGEDLMAATVCLAEVHATELDLGFAPAESSRRGQEELEKSGLFMHTRIDRSEPAVIERIREALDFTDSKMEQFREDVRQWRARSSSRAGSR